MHEWVSFKVESHRKWFKKNFPQDSSREWNFKKNPLTIEEASIFFVENIHKVLFRLTSFNDGSFSALKSVQRNSYKWSLFQKCKFLISKTSKTRIHLIYLKDSNGMCKDGCLKLTFHDSILKLCGNLSISLEGEKWIKAFSELKFSFLIDFIKKFFFFSVFSVKLIKLWTVEELRRWKKKTLCSDWKVLKIKLQTYFSIKVKT